jgi:hypothetical protein
MVTRAATAPEFMVKYLVSKAVLRAAPRLLVEMSRSTTRG